MLGLGFRENWVFSSSPWAVLDGDLEHSLEKDFVRFSGPISNSGPASPSVGSVCLCLADPGKGLLSISNPGTILVVQSVFELVKGGAGE